MGFRHIGKKVELASTRIDKDLFLERTKTVSTGKMNLALVGIDGKVLPSNVSHAVSVLGDNNDAITTTDLIKGLMKITPTGSRTKAFPSAASIIDALNFKTEFQFVDVSIINLSGSNAVEVSAGTNVTLHGNVTVATNSSGLFRIVALTSAVEILRIA
jgi:hypothetical protein